MCQESEKGLTTWQCCPRVQWATGSPLPHDPQFKEPMQFLALNVSEEITEFEVKVQSGRPPGQLPIMFVHLCAF